MQVVCCDRDVLYCMDPWVGNSPSADDGDERRYSVLAAPARRTATKNLVTDGGTLCPWVLRAIENGDIFLDTAEVIFLVVANLTGMWPTRSVCSC